MTYLQSLILGVVEGLTEFLPISSTAHLILTSHILRIQQTEFVKSFEIVIQLGAILAVVFLYFKKFIFDRETLKKILVAFLPTAILGFLLYKIFKNFLMESNTLISLSLIFGGIFIILFEKFHKEETSEENLMIPYWKYFLVGIFQSIAIIPGISRSAATILGGSALGFKRKDIVEFSFLLAVPTMLAASGYDLLKSGISFSAGEFGVLIFGFCVSFIVALWAIKFLLRFIQKNNFVKFGIYRIIAGLIFLFV